MSQFAVAGVWAPTNSGSPEMPGFIGFICGEMEL